MEKPTKHPLYSVWSGMKNRCFNSNSRDWPRYGGRGITVCDRWRNSFDNFVADMGPRPPGLILDRRDNNGNYEPGNCRWVDSMTSGFNVRSIRMLTINGRTQHAAAWGREYGMDPGLIINRYDRGMPHEKILSKEKFSARMLGHKGGGRPTTAKQQEVFNKLKAIVDGL